MQHNRYFLKPLETLNKTYTVGFITLKLSIPHFMRYTTLMRYAVFNTVLTFSFGAFAKASDFCPLTFASKDSNPMITNHVYPLLEF
jgi:hypothetical protein